MTNKAAMKFQAAALPYRKAADGKTEILLITSRETRRWILPKGWIENNVKPHETAALEAFEEAGVRGRTKKKPVDSYNYLKRLHNGDHVLCKVSVFTLKVVEELDDWPEKKERERRWMSVGQAAMLISEGGLVRLLLSLSLPGARFPK
ncbi:MAG TPA: NUDIX hydrolase [Azospirillaceae bacterium]|nr:NUDIX hydrolase [Azospirillaceae bacterium]HRQ81627.1 NUDIX hydrolase [Azospirillaceae bacterium]